MSIDPTDPGLLFGGTWEQIQGKFLLAASEEYPVNSTGGEDAHTLSVAEMPSHLHTISGVSPTSHTPAAGGNGYYLPFSDMMSVNTNATGGGQPHNNMPPYLAVYMWRRVG